MIKRYFAVCFFILAFIVLPLGSFSVSAENEEIERIPLVSASEDIPSSVYYYQGNYKVKPSAFTWVEGRNDGKAVQLNGTNQYIRIATATTKELKEFTFSTWIRWGGNSTEGQVDAQELLTLYRNESYYLTVSPHAQNEDIKLNGIHMQWASADWDPISVFTPAEKTSTFALPVEEWHHITVTASGEIFSLYVDGVELLQQKMNVDFESFDFRTFKIGAGFSKKPYLNAALQDAVLYTSVLTDEQILLLSQDKDPLSGESATTTTQSLATRPTEETQATTTTTNQSNLPERVWGLPIGLLFVLGAVVLVVIVLSVVFSLQNAKQISKEDDDE